MSVNTRSSDGSTNSENNAVVVEVSPEKAQRVMATAEARADPDDAKAAVPQETSIEGTPEFFDQLFDENGMAFDSWWEWKSFDDDPAWEDSFKSGEKRRALLNNPRDRDTAVVSPDEDAEAFLEAVDPERLEAIDEKFGELPGTREDLIEVQARKAAQELGEDEITQSAELVITKHQDDPEPKVDGDVQQHSCVACDHPKHGHSSGGDSTVNGVTVEDGRVVECPKCGSQDVSADTVEIQTKGADESGTQVTKLGCGCTVRRSD